MIYDIVPFHQEVDVLALRLATLAPLGACHIVLIGDHDFAGRPVDRHAALDLASRAVEDAGTDARNVIAAAVTVPPTCRSRWVREWTLRNKSAAALAGIEDVRPQDGDVVILADVDEIPRPEAVRRAEALMAATPLDDPVFLTLELRTFYYAVTHEVDEQSACVVTRAGTLLDGAWSPQGLRNARRWGPHRLPDAGWHFSYMGGVNAVTTKVARFSHAEFDTPAVHAALPERVAQRVDPFGRASRSWTAALDDTMPAPLVREPQRWARLLEGA